MKLTHLILIGAGGHARAVIDVVNQLFDYKVECIIDLSYNGQYEKILDIPVYGRLDDFLKPDFEYSLHVSIGDNANRAEIYEQFQNTDYAFPPVIANSAVVSPSASIGSGSFISPLTFIGPEVVIGENTIINSGAVVEHGSVIGDHCHIAPNATIAGRCSVGNYSMVGLGSCMLPKLSLGQKITIGANSTVIKSISEPGTYAGSPARRLK